MTYIFNLEAKDIIMRKSVFFAPILKDLLDRMKVITFPLELF